MAASEGLECALGCVQGQAQQIQGKWQGCMQIESFGSAPYIWHFANVRFDVYKGQASTYKASGVC